MGRFVMDMEGQATFGHCLQPSSSSSSSSSSSIVVVVIIAVFLHCLHCNNRSSQNPYFSSGKVYVGEYRYDKENGIGILRFFTSQRLLAPTGALIVMMVYYISGSGNFFRFSLSPLMQLMLQVSL